MGIAGDTTATASTTAAPPQQASSTSTPKATTIDSTKTKNKTVPELAMVDASEDYSTSHHDDEDDSSNSSGADKEKQQAAANAERRRRMEELEAAAVDQAKAVADAAFKPSPSILNAPTAAVLLQQVDGPVPLYAMDTRESVYVGRSIPIAAGGKLQVPISVTTPGSVVEYAVELQAADVQFGITAERDEGVTIVKEPSRMDAETESPLTQKFLVGTVPCLLQFGWDNGYSWLREKVISYKITVTPPSHESLQAGRRRRAAACLKAVQDDLQAAQTRLQAASASKQALQERVANLMKLLQEAKQSWQVAEKEEAWLLERCALRVEQEKLLLQRLQHGWEDEKEGDPKEKERQSSSSSTEETTSNGN